MRDKIEGKCNCDLCRCETKEDYFNNMCDELRKVILENKIAKYMTFRENIDYIIYSSLEFITEAKE